MRQTDDQDPTPAAPSSGYRHESFSDIETQAGFKVIIAVGSSDSGPSH